MDILDYGFIRQVFGRIIYFIPPAWKLEFKKWSNAYRTENNHV